MTILGDRIRPILKAHFDAFLKKFGKDNYHGRLDQYRGTVQ